MRVRHCPLLVLIPLLALLPASSTAQTSRPTSGPASQPAASELKAEVPELTAFHEVIFELWHKAWPEKNATLLKELLPKAQRDFATLRGAGLPGILRDKQEKWNEGLTAMAGALAEYEKGAGADDLTAMLDAVEKLHASFERQARIVHPPMKELDAFHVELYQIYHHAMPDRKLEDLRSGAVRMSERCVELAAAPVPRRLQEKPDPLKEKIATLCGATTGLVKTAAGDDWKAIDAAVEEVHAAYLGVLGLFDAGH